MALERQSSVLPPAQPSYILRGHTSQIHSVRFVRNNTRLFTGDADGWVVLWRVETKRALAVWKAHDAAILGTAEWGRDKVITHGRDNSLRVWQLRTSDEESLSKILPAEPSPTPRPKPWLLHILPVNTLNFCAFSACHALAPSNDTLSNSESRGDATYPESIFIAVPSRDDKKAEVYQLPEERLRFVVPRAQSKDTGMVMALKLVRQAGSSSTELLVGYEGGLTAVFKLPYSDDMSVAGVAEVVYLSQPHTQPILSLDVSPDGKTYYTSAADAIIAAHRIPELSTQADEHAAHRVDAKTAEDMYEITGLVQTPAQTSISSPSSQRENVQSEAVVRNNTEIGHQPAHDDFSFSKQSIPALHKAGATTGILSSLLSSDPSKTNAKPSAQPPALVIPQSPYKLSDTKHAGQQSLRVRSDGRLLVTGGWDSRIRIYSAKTLKEVAVLRWHKEGVYATDFGRILEAKDVENGENDDEKQYKDISKRETGLARFQRQREEQLQLKHWVVAGAKDGKVSLWEVF